jgi:hypothetical protein
VKPGERFDEWLALRGQRVIVLLDDRAPSMSVEGVLIALDPYGEVELLCDDGKYHWCWPALDVSPADRRAWTKRAQSVEIEVDEYE